MSGLFLPFTEMYSMEETLKELRKIADGIREVPVPERAHQRKSIVLMFHYVQ